MSLLKEFDARISVLDDAGWEDITRRVRGLVEWMKEQNAIESVLRPLRSGQVYAQLILGHHGCEKNAAELGTNPENIAAVGLAIMERCTLPHNPPVHLHQIARPFGIRAPSNHPAPQDYEFDAALKRYIYPLLDYVKQRLSADQGTAASSTASAEFLFDVFVNHSSKDKAVVREIATRLKMDGLRVWFDEWVLKPGDSIPAKIEEGLEHSRVLVLCMSANAFGSDWAQLEAGTFRFRDPMNRERRFIPLRLDAAPIKGSLAQFLYIDWLPAGREQEYAKLLEACRPQAKTMATSAIAAEEPPRIGVDSHTGLLSATDDYVQRRRNSIEKAFSTFEPVHAFFFKVCIDYMSFVEILHAGLTASDADRTKYYGYIKEIGHRLQELHVLEGRLSIAGAERAVRLMQQYRLQATEVNDMIRLQLPAMRGEQARAVTEELFRRKDRLYEELAKTLKEDSTGEVLSRSPTAGAATSSSIGNAWSGLRGLLLQEYSTQIIKGILGKAGLQICRPQFAGTYKGPVLDEADKLISSMSDSDRNRFAAGCVQEIIAFEKERAANLAKRGIQSNGFVLRNLRQVLATFGHDLTTFESA